MGSLQLRMKIKKNVLLLLCIFQIFRSHGAFAEYSSHRRWKREVLGITPQNPPMPATRVVKFRSPNGSTFKREGASPQLVGLVQQILEQEKAMAQAENKRSLAKRFVNFLKATYPHEMDIFSQAVHDRARRATVIKPRQRRFLIKSRRRKQQVSKEKGKEPKMVTCGCNCKVSTECTESEELDKFRLFYSNPPSCRPTSTPYLNADDLNQSTDMCGHSCQCHACEEPTTDNDKEIYVGRRETTTSL